MLVYDANTALQSIVEIDPDVIVVDIENSNRDQLENMLQVSRALKRPVATFVDQSDQASTEATIDAGVSAYINAFDRLRRELEAARNQLADRKKIDRAKAILMRSRGLSEPEACALLRRTAMNRSKRMAEIAEWLIVAAGLLDEEGKA